MKTKGPVIKERPPNPGASLIIIGILLCFTGVGIVVGGPLILLGFGVAMAVAAKTPEEPAPTPEEIQEQEDRGRLRERYNWAAILMTAIGFTGFLAIAAERVRTPIDMTFAELLWGGLFLALVLTCLHYRNNNRTYIRGRRGLLTPQDNADSTFGCGFTVAFFLACFLVWCLPSLP